MPLVEISYVAGVLEGKAAGVQVAVKDVGDRALVGMTKGQMSTRIAKMIGAISNALKMYVHLQYQTSGGGLSALSSKVGDVGGSSDMWEPLDEKTRLARAKGWGYYVSKGEGDKPLLWTGLSRSIAKQSISVSAAGVDVKVTHFAIKYNESIRPVFVLSEVSRLAKAIAVKTFEGTRRKANIETGEITKESAFDDEGAFGFRVGESRPFSFPKGGRPKTGKLSKLLPARFRKGEKTKRKTAGGFTLRNIRSQLRQFKRDFGGSPEEGDQ